MVGVPVTLASWVLGMIVNQGVLVGLSMLITATLALVAVITGILLLVTIMEIGSKLWKGEKITWRTL